MSDSAAFVFHATTNYGDPTAKGLSYKIQNAACPVPGCIWIGELTASNNFPWHNNMFGFACDSVGRTITQAKTLQIDEHGRLLDVDEMQKVDL